MIKQIHHYETLFTTNRTFKYGEHQIEYRVDNFGGTVKLEITGDYTTCGIRRDNDMRLWLEFHELKTVRGKIHFLLDHAMKQNSMVGDVGKELYAQLEKGMGR